MERFVEWINSSCNILCCGVIGVISVIGVMMKCYYEVCTG
jgi:hypothetical protein